MGNDIVILGGTNKVIEAGQVRLGLDIIIKKIPNVVENGVLKNPTFRTYI